MREIRGRVVALEVRDVTAGYRGKVALRDVNIVFRRGINVVLGPNGAGKTTLFRVCSGVLKPYKGVVLVGGRNVYDDSRVRSVIGYLPHLDGLVSGLTVRENLMFYAKIYNLSDINAGILELAKEFGVENLLNTPVAHLSHGQRRRVTLIRVLLHDPQVLLLDEPSNGLDPLAAKNFRNFVKNLARSRGITLVYSTHNLYEALELAENVVVLNHGRVMFKGSLDELKRSLERIKIGLRVRGNPTTILNSMGYHVSRDDGLWVVEAKSEDEIGYIIEELVKHGITVLEVKEIGNPLEDILERLGDQS